jgi:hypothetical protein
MNYRDFTELFRKQISFLEYRSAMKFSILICKKLYIDYKRYTEVEDWGNADIVMETIDLCQKAVESSIDSNKIKISIHQIAAWLQAFKLLTTPNDRMLYGYCN